MRRPLCFVALLLLALGWNGALLAATAADTPTPVSAATYFAGSLICHQRPERSFHRDGAQYPVCARCFGLYAGAVAGILAWAGIAGVGRHAAPRALRLADAHAKSTLMIVAVPTLASVALAWLGIWDGSNLWRAALALPLGAAIAAAIAAAAAGDLR